MSQATPVTKVRIYHPIQARRSEGHQLVGEFALDPASGHAVLVVLDETARTQLERFAGGLASTPLRRTVTPTEGELFLRTLQETFQNSTYWRIIDHRAAL
jgi:hypothetical protein